MKIYRGLHDKAMKRKKRCIAIGVFDGVHRGHQKILRQVVHDARRTRASAMAVTFEPHPMKVLRPKAADPILISLAHRLRFFEKMGFQETLVIPFSKRFSKITHEFFLESLLFKRLGMLSLSVGHDFRFGHQGLGTTAYLAERSKMIGFRLSVFKPVRIQRKIISSTSIRRLIESGRLAKAAQMLGRPVSVYGTVVHGRGRGEALGFPTANLNPHHETLPPSGVYAAWGYLNKKRLRGVIHIGERPTFQDRERSLEVHFFDFHRTIYGKELELIFVKRLRSIRRFPTREALKKAIRDDSKRALKALYKAAGNKYNRRYTNK